MTRPRSKLTAAIALALVLALAATFVASTAHAQTPAAATGSACEQPDRAACRRAQAHHERAERALEAQAARVRAATSLRAQVAVLDYLLQESTPLQQRAQVALTQATQSAADAHASLHAAREACAVLPTALDQRQQAAERYRSAAQTFADAAANQAPSAAAAADQALDALRAAEAQASNRAAACTQRLADAQQRLAQWQGRARDTDRALDTTRALESRLQGTLERLQAALKAYPLPPNADLTALQRRARSHGLEVTAWVAVVPSTTAELPAAVATRWGVHWTPEPALAAQRQRVVADDALLYWRVTGANRREQCQGEATCLTQAQDLHAQRQARAQQAEQAWTVQQADMASALARLAEAAQAAQPAEACLREASAALATPRPAPRDEAARQRLDAQLGALEQQERAREARAEAAEARAWAVAYGPRESIDLEAAAAGGGPPPPPPAATVGPMATAHAHQFVNDQVPETPDYAAYTYVYLANSAPAAVSTQLVDSYRKTLTTVVANTTASSGVDASRRGDFNLFCVPNQRAEARNRSRETAGDWLLDEYDPAYLEHLMVNSHAGAVLRAVRDSRHPGYGPYLLTTFRPLAQTRSGDRLLFVDLSQVPADYVPDLVESYKRRFLQPPPTEERTEWKPNLAQLVVMNVDRMGQAIKQLKSAAGWDVAKGLGGDAKQAFVRVTP